MTPEDVLIEAIAAASLHGDSDALRRLMCAKLADSIRRAGAYYAVPFESENAMSNGRT
jgi:hypothetical protein